MTRYRIDRQLTTLTGLHPVWVPMEDLGVPWSTPDCQEAAALARRLLDRGLPVRLVKYSEEVMEIPR